MRNEFLVTLMIALAAGCNAQLRDADQVDADIRDGGPYSADGGSTDAAPADGGARLDAGPSAPSCAGRGECTLTSRTCCGSALRRWSETWSPCGGIARRSTATASAAARAPCLARPARRWRTRTSRRPAARAPALRSTCERTRRARARRMQTACSATGRGVANPAARIRRLGSRRSAKTPSRPSSGASRTRALARRASQPTPRTRAPRATPRRSTAR